MMDREKKVRALGLCSGGLDSILSALVLREQGIHVEWVSFETPFFSSEKARAAAEQIHVPLIVKRITPVYMEMLKNPRVGYGKYMNPCMDCHRLMFQLAGAIMTEMGFDFLFSGEVLGQRPMSQTRSALRHVEKHSGYDGYIVRPLSAGCLPETLVEKSGKVKRERLLDVKGRSRKPQMALAKKYHVTTYPAPAGGCLLTDPGYSRRLKDLFDHLGNPTEADLELLKYGRHIRLNEGEKIIVGRTREDNEAILVHYGPSKDVMIKLDNIPGPVVLSPHGLSRDGFLKACAICAGYAKVQGGESVHAVVTSPGGQERISVHGVSPEDVKGLLI